jgi:hypothetical protein
MPELVRGKRRLDYSGLLVALALTQPAKVPEESRVQTPRNCHEEHASVFSVMVSLAQCGSVWHPIVVCCWPIAPVAGHVRHGSYRE